MPLRRFAVIGAALIGEDGVRDVTTAPRHDDAAVDIGSKSWLPLRDIAAGDVRPVATNGLESGRFQGFL